ncbi:hypothetical protein [Austwickia sp. TVS 96-490-7B]|uniref:hypothetical protein n=1 Tax=Austwickia sp. TVS 96-490-7B TaxID=2830843 RepID=UPI001C575575|nr:hypothetical protein [Austwickia sp. TVS 96-490-7B]
MTSQDETPTPTAATRPPTSTHGRGTWRSLVIPAHPPAPTAVAPGGAWSSP